jgi:hypothetical protein
MDKKHQKITVTFFAILMALLTENEGNESHTFQKISHSLGFVLLIGHNPDQTFFP